MPRPEVRDSEEFRRVRDGARRKLTQADADAWAEALTPEVLQPGARARLRPWQAAAIAEVVENDGGLLGLPVGAGKTLITYVTARLFGAKRPMLIVPASLRDKTRHDFASYVGTWRAPNPPPLIVSREQISPDDQQIIERRQPDLILIDEADDLANRRSSACRALDRYIVSNRDRYTRADPDWVRVVAMTGTLSRKSLMGYWHLLCWCLDDRAPVPLGESEAAMWAAALDEASGRGAAQRRPLPGPLGATRAEALEWFRTRLIETPGVVIVDGDSCTAPLTVRQRIAKECPEINAKYERFLLEGEVDDMVVSDPLSRWRVDGFLGCGLYQHYDPPPPDEWRTTRRAIAALVRESIEHSDTLDTEAQVLRRFADHPLVQEWREIKPTFIPERNTVAVWFSTATVESALEWLHEAPDVPSIVWCGNVEFGRAFADVARLSYYGEQGRDQNGRGLHVAPPDRSMVASWNANKKGFNLQPWRRALLVHPPQSAKWLEQIFGRNHRSGQDFAVEITMLCTSGGTLDAFDTACGEARHVRRSVGMTQKLLRATIVPATPRITRANRFRWARKGDLDSDS